MAEDLGEEPPSYWVVYRIVSSLPDDLVTLAHQGSKAYSESFELIHRREASGPNAIWQADHTPLDILLIRPDGETAKPWLSTVIDDYSRAVAGYFLSFQNPSALHTSLALRQAIWRKEDARWVVCGIPDVLYTDNGSDFTSNHLEQVGADSKIRLVFSIPGKPRGRGRIERFFSTVNETFLCELDGYAPGRRSGPRKASLRRCFAGSSPDWESKRRCGPEFSRVTPFPLSMLGPLQCLGRARSFSPSIHGR